MLSFNQFIINEEKKNSDIQEFIKFAASKLGLKDLPSFDLDHDAHSYRSFGGYSEDGIGVTTRNRHTMDVCRTIAHELVHYKQDKDGKLKYDGEDGKAGSPMENEANAKAAVIMRAWADERPELFKEESVNEKWSKKYKRSIDCDNPKGFSQKAHCAGKEKNEEVTNEACWDGYKQEGMKKKGNKTVPNCVKESVELSEQSIPYDKNAHIGFWKDQGEKEGHYTLYHGTHERNIPSMLKHGLNKPDPTTGMISTTPDPNTAHGYAAMSGTGGETQFRKLHNKAVNTPHEERSVVKMRIPKAWADKHIDPQLRGNLGVTRDRMLNKSHYDAWKKQNPEKSDSEYYTGSEVRFSKPIPPEFIVGHMKRFPNGVKKTAGRKKVTEEKLGKIQRTPGGPKKFAVKVKNDKGNVVTVRFGDPNMEIKRDDPERRKSFRARHHCDTNPGPRWKARYWSCKQWRAGKKVEG